jgi:hypothetical protein
MRRIPHNLITHTLKLQYLFLTLHQMRRKSRNLVSHALGRNNRDLLADLLVDLEIQSQLGVETLHNNAGALLHGFGSDATHLGFVLLHYVKSLRCVCWSVV